MAARYDEARDGRTEWEDICERDEETWRAGRPGSVAVARRSVKEGPDGGTDVLTAASPVVEGIR
jgi:hypothetical protein